MSGLFDYSSFINNDLLAQPQCQLVQLLCTFCTHALSVFLHVNLATHHLVSDGHKCKLHSTLSAQQPAAKWPPGFSAYWEIDQDISDLSVVADVDNDALHFGYWLIEWR